MANRVKIDFKKLDVALNKKALDLRVSKVEVLEYLWFCKMWTYFYRDRKRGTMTSYRIKKVEDRWFDMEEFIIHE